MSEKISFIETLNQVRENLPAIQEASDLFDEEIVERLDELALMDLNQITSDLVKGNYLGNRKIDINLTLNNNSDTEAVAYQGAKLVLNDGMALDIDFETLLDDGTTTAILELTSHADIKNYIANHALYTANVINTELTVEDAIGTTPQLIRFRDADGRASNIDRVELLTYSGNFVESQPAYYWAKTTSALQTLANRVGDVIALGQRIDKIIALADKEDEIQYLYDTRASLQVLHDNIQKVIDVEANLDNINAVNDNKTNIDTIVASKTSIDTVATNKDAVVNVSTNMNAVLDAPAQAQIASQKAAEATAVKDELLAITPSTIDLASNENSFISYNPTTGAFVIGLPKGLKGDTGESFDVDATGTIANRSAYDGASQGFAYLSLDENPTMVYFKKSDTSGDWTDGVPFGKGDKGDKGDTGVSIVNIQRTAGDGSAGTTDTYTITLSDTSTHTFTVYNGADLTNSQIIDDSTPSDVTTYSSSKVDDLLLDMELGIPT